MATFELSAQMTVRPGRDGAECEVRELYESPQGLIEHKAHIGAALHKLFELYPTTTL